MVELVFTPSATIVASTIIDPRGIDLWAKAHGLVSLLDDDSTPLGVLWSDMEDSGNLNVSLDALPEFAGRHCYRSFEKGRDRDAYIANIIEMEHGSVLEHSNVSFAISGVSRSLTHELVRHRAGAAPSQESQRYVDASQIRFVVPPLLDAYAHKVEYAEGEGLLRAFMEDCEYALERYRWWQETLAQPAVGDNIKLGTMAKKRANEAARAVLPNAAETRLVWTMNMRTARHICALRGGEGADLEIRRLAVEMTDQLQGYAPAIFHDFEIYRAEDGFFAVRCDRPKV